jgi:hypothetical protein
VNASWARGRFLLLVGGETDPPFPMVSDAGTVGCELTGLEALVEGRGAQAEHALGFAESPAPIPLCRQRAIQARYLLRGQPDPSRVARTLLLRSQEASPAPVADHRSGHAQLGGYRSHADEAVASGVDSLWDEGTGVDLDQWLSSVFDEADKTRKE